jgi:glycosyltransferase involved in cell wall biosynthesis
MTPAGNDGVAPGAPLSGTEPVVMQLVLSLVAGGTERLAIDIVTRLANTFRMVVCCLDAPGEWAGELTSRDVPVVPLHRALGFHPSIGSRVARVAEQHGVSVIHCHHYSPFVYGQIARVLNRRLRLVFTEHGRLSDDPPLMKRRIANVILGRMSGSMFAVSSALREHMIAEGFPAGRVGVIHNGIDPGAPPAKADRLAARRLLGIADDAFLVGTAARLDSVKDLGTLIKATARLRTRRPDARVVIIGSGDEQKSLEATRLASGCPEAIHLIGYRSDVRRLLPALDVFVNSSISEGVSLTILEAMAAAVPVVATRVGGTPEVVLDGTTGLLVDSRSPEALADALFALSKTPERRAAFGSAGRARVETAFTLDRMVADYAREYRRMGRN